MKFMHLKSVLFHVVAQTIAKVPFTPGHEMVGEVSHYLGLVQFAYSQLTVPYSTEITPTFIACYKAATGGMGLISKTVVLPRN